MALVAVSRQYFPVPLLGTVSQANSFAANAITYDSDTDRAAWVGRSPVTDTLTTIYFRTLTVTTGCTVTVRVETTTNGRPSGTLFGTNTEATVVIADGDDNAWKTATLTAAASLAMGDEFAIIIVVDTSGATPNLQLALGCGSITNFVGLYPAVLQDTGAGTWANPAALPWEWICQFGTAGVIPMEGMIPTSGGGTITAFNSGSADDEFALRFQIPYACRVIGIRAVICNVAAAGDFTASLWPASSTTDGDALGQRAIDGDAMPSTTADGYVDAMFDAPVTLATGTTYYAGIRADTANSVSIAELSTATVSNAMLAFPGASAQTYRSRRAWTAGSAGAWSDTTANLPLIYLIIDQLDNGAGGGGLLTHPGMSGGMRG